MGNIGAVEGILSLHGALLCLYSPYHAVSKGGGGSQEHVEEELRHLLCTIPGTGP